MHLFHYTMILYHKSIHVSMCYTNIIKYYMAAGFFRKRYRKGTKYSVSRVAMTYKSPFYQLLRNSLYNFSTRLLTVLTTSVIFNLEQAKTKGRQSICGLLLGI